MLFFISILKWIFPYELYPIDNRIVLDPSISGSFFYLLISTIGLV